MKYLNLTTLGHHLSSFGWDQVKWPLAALKFSLPLQGIDVKIWEGGEYSEFCKSFMCVSKTTGGKFQQVRSESKSPQGTVSTCTGDWELTLVFRLQGGTGQMEAVLTPKHEVSGQGDNLTLNFA